MVDRKNVNTITLEQINAQYGKLPPQAVDVEEAVIGALMLEKEAFLTISGIVEARSFYKEEHQKIFSTIKEISESGSPIDLLTVIQKLKDLEILDEIGGPGNIVSLTERVASAAHIEFHAKIIAQKFIQRELIRVSTDIQTKSYDDTLDIDDLLNAAKTEINRLDDFLSYKNHGKTTDVVAKESLEDLEFDVAEKKKGVAPGITTGLMDLDNSTGGWRKTNLITLAARPGIGKTSLALYFAVSAARSGKWVNFYGLEMKSTDLFRILLSGETDIDRTSIRDGNIEDYQWANINMAASDLGKLQIVWNDDPNITVDQIASNTRKNKRDGKCDIVIIDYLQLVNPTNKKVIREQQIAEITRKLKKTAMNEDIPIIELSQLNRNVENRPGGEPFLSDLRESGSIEQDSDVVAFLYETDGFIKLKVSKNRRGKKGPINFWANEEKTKFADYEPMSADFAELPVNNNFEKEPF